MAIPEEVIQEIKYRNEIEAVISPYVNLRRAGKNLVGLCPFHNEKSPSFTVYPENGSFYCFGCGVGGDVFTFTRLIENLDYIEAVKLLAEKSGVTLPQDGYDDSMQKLRAKIYEINRETAKFYHEYLLKPEGKWALEYFTGRGLTLATIRHFGLGAAPDSWTELYDHLRKFGYSDSDLIQANVVGRGKNGGCYDRFRHRAMFPIINIRGKVIGFSGRAMPGDEKAGGKYVNTADTPVYKKSENLFAMNFAKNHCADRIILVEGNMDVVSLHQAGFENTVAALGTAFTPEQAKLLSRYTKEIVLTMDADAAGQKAVRRAGEILKNTGLDVRVVVVPDGKDPDEFIKKNGAPRFAALLDGAVSEIEYKLFNASQAVDMESDDGKLKYLNAAAEIIADVPDAMTRDFYIRRLTDKLAIVSRTTLEDRVNRLRKNQQKQTEKKKIDEIIHPRFQRDDINPERRQFPRGCVAEETLIAILFQHPDLYSLIDRQLTEDQMLTSLNRRICKRLFEILAGGGTPDISDFGEILQNPAEIGYLVSLCNSERAEIKPDSVLRDCIRVILEDGKLKASSSSEDVSVDDWAEQLKNMIESKKKGN